MGTRLGTQLGTILGTILGTDLGGAGAAPFDSSIYYANNFSAGNHYDTVIPGGEAGTAAGFVKVWVFAIESQAVASANRVIGGRVSGTGGYCAFTSGTNGGMQAVAVNGAGGFIIPPVFTLPASSVLKWLHFTLVHTGSALRQYVQGAQYALDANAPITGYTAAAVASIIGRRFDSLPADNVRFAGDFSATGVPSGAAVLKHYAQFVATRDIPTTMDGVTATHSSSVRRNQAGSAPTTLTDTPGTDNYTKVGTPGFGADLSPAFFSPSGTVDLYIGGGDSQMEGAATSTGAPVGYPPTDRTMFMTRNDLMLRELAEPCGEGYPLTGWGPGGMFAWYKRTATGRNTIFLNIGWGGLRTDQMLPATAYYTRFLSKLAVVKECPGVVLRGFLDFSGANNALQGTTGWGTDMAVIEAAMRADCLAAGLTGAGSVPFLYTRQRSTLTGADPTALAAERSDQLAYAGLAANRVMLQQQDAWSMQPDGIHMYAAGNDSWAQAAAALI